MAVSRPLALWFSLIFCVFGVALDRPASAQSAPPEAAQPIPPQGDATAQPGQPNGPQGQLAGPQGQPNGPQGQPNGQLAAPPAEVPPPPGQLLVRMALPPGTFTAALSLNDTFAGWLPGGVLGAPLWLWPGGYAVRVSAPGLRPYETSIQLAPGQVIELTGALLATEPSAPLIPLGPAPAPPAPRKRPRSFASTYRAVLYGIGAACLGVVVVGGIVALAVCSSGDNCKSRGSHHDFD